MSRGAHLAIALVLVWLPAGSVSAQTAEHDPWEKWNRRIFWFNDRVDVYVLEPAARAWHAVLPDRVERAIGNFFRNLRVPSVAVNDLLQGKPRATGTDLLRFAVNTSVGIAGFFDPASHWGIPEREEDVGQTLGRWGVPPGPYVVLPFVGPSNPRDAVGLVGDWALTIYPFFVDRFVTLGVNTVQVVNRRAELLDEVRNAKKASFDYYAFARNAYIQRRATLVADRPSAVTDEEELYYFEEEDWEEGPSEGANGE
ncbi:MAG: hypothetical protein KatS3mg076_1979 [Candidatus Binatia bacterium]|nr:MAG: hypothetical protein KatS3mg076_1979 [Candidatus Binatia bacterium]